eukprot:5881903-Amphidinium_carterae.1
MSHNMRIQKTISRKQQQLDFSVLGSDSQTCHLGCAVVLTRPNARTMQVKFWYHWGSWGYEIVICQSFLFLSL